VHPITVSSEKAADLANSRVQQRRVPQQPAYVAGVKSFTLPKQAQLCCVCLQAQYQAFIGFMVESSTASAIALNSTCFWNLSPGGLSFRELGLTRIALRGQQPWTDVVSGT